MATIVTKWESGAFTNHKLREALNNAEGEWLEVTIRRARYKPSPRSHRYYRGYLLPVLTQAMNDAGCEHNGRPLNVEWVHRMLKALFAVQVSQQGDDFAYAVPSCSELDAEQMKQYIMLVERYAIEEWGIQPMDIE